MARELGIAKTFRRMLRSRFRSDVYGDIRGLLDTILPVQVVGQDYHDTERPQWGITTAFAAHAARYCTSSITSAVDISIEAVSVEGYLPLVGNPRPWPGPFLLLTPPTTWIPWIDAAPPTYHEPGIRPRTVHDPGQTIAIAGQQNNAAPYWGAEIHSDINASHLVWVDPLTGYTTNFQYNYYQGNTWHRFLPSLILPAGMFLTAVASRVGCDFFVSWRYREIG